MKLEFTPTDGVGPQVTAAAPPADTRLPAPPPPLTFDMPARVFGQLVAVAAGYLLVMGLAFRDGTGIGLLFAIFGVVGIGYYGLPWLMARASAARRDPFPPNGAWGIDTASGYLPGRAAWAQVMTVPLLMLAWAIVVAILV
jgi:hypothetical protein